MPYRAFVSATFEDLTEHRQRVIGALRRAGLDVEAMEEFSASSESPRVMCERRMARCNVCVLLVGYRRGALPPGEKRSFVQIEYETARALGTEVLVFISEGDPEANTAWNLRFDERTRDPAFVEWRTELRDLHHVRSFGHDPNSIPIDAAIAQWVVNIESSKAARFRRKTVAVALLSAGAIFLGIAYMAFIVRSPGQRRQYLSIFLSHHDPGIFNSATDGQYEIARALAGTGDLGENTRLSDDIRGTLQSFDMLANTAQNIRDAQQVNILDIVHRAGKVRIILWDYGARTQPFYDPFVLAIGCISTPGTLTQLSPRCTSRAAPGEER